MNIRIRLKHEVNGDKCVFYLLVFKEYPSKTKEIIKIELYNNFTKEDGTAKEPDPLDEEYYNNVRKALTFSDIELREIIRPHLLEYSKSVEHIEEEINCYEKDLFIGLERGKENGFRRDIGDN